VFLISGAGGQRFRYWRTGFVAAAGLVGGLLLLTLLFGYIVAIGPEGSGRVVALAEELGFSLAPRPEQGLAAGWALAAVAVLLPRFLLARVSYAALVLFLAAIFGLAIMLCRQYLNSEQKKVDKVSRDSGDQKSNFSEELNSLADSGSGVSLPWPGTAPFVFLLIITGALLTMGPEFLYLRDNFGFRLNTIFKFYYQAWIVFGVAALYGIGYLWQGSRRVAPVVATTGYGLALAASLLFPYLAVNSRALEYRGPLTAETRLPPTLDGLAQVARFNPDEYLAISWLRENVQGTPVILEAIGGQYSGFGRIAASTGLPTLLGWAGHEYQWRGDTPEPALRDPAVREIYSETDLANVAHLLDDYDVEYVYVGPLERDTYGVPGIEKFAGQLPTVFSQNGVTIYRWQPQ
jgi:hypothetical protein